MALHIFIFSTVVLFSKECMTETLFVQMGTSIQLNISKLTAENNTLLWSKDKYNLVRYEKPKVPKILDGYKNRVVFNSTNLSLTLMNMLKNDSGPYKAITRGDSDFVVAEYFVSVIDGVEAPDLIVTPNWFSSDSCTVNFTCRAHDLTLYFSYQNNKCPEGKKTSLGISTLILNCTEDTIICNHSNPVSWKIETQKVEQCHSHKKRWHTIPWVLLLCIAVCLLFLFYRKRKWPGSPGTHRRPSEKDSNNIVPAKMDPAPGPVEKQIATEDRANGCSKELHVQDLSGKGDKRSSTSQEETETHFDEPASESDTDRGISSEQTLSADSSALTDPATEECKEDSPKYEKHCSP